MKKREVMRNWNGWMQSLHGPGRMLLFVCGQIVATTDNLLRSVSGNAETVSGSILAVHSANPFW